MAMMKELREALHFASTLQFWRMAVLWTLSLILSYFHLFIQTFLSPISVSYPRCSPPPLPPPDTADAAHRRPICVITGATSGLGAAAAEALAREGFYVVLAGRSPHLLSKTISDIRKRNGDAHLKAFVVDLSSFQSIMKFKDSLQQWLLDSDMHSSIQLLINNAGILAISQRFTVEDHDIMMGTNYIAAFCLTKALLPLLESSPVPSRIVNVTSFTHRNVSDMQVDKETVAVFGKRFLELECYPYAHIYEYSKACILLFSYELHRQFALMGKSHQVSVSAADPGVVKTEIMREIPSCLSQVAFWVLKIIGLLQSPDKGVHSILDAALAPPGTSGVYFFGGNGRTTKSSALSYDTKLSEELWATSCNLFFELQLSSADTST